MVVGAGGGGEDEGRDSLEFGMHMYTVFEMNNQQGLLCSTWNSAHCYVAAWMGGEFGGEWILGYV